jgi:type IV secretion system protein VirD4
MVDKQRDSVKMTVTKALTAWLRMSIRDRDRRPSIPPFSMSLALPSTFVARRRRRRTFGSHADGAAHCQQRTKVAQEHYPRIGTFPDELPNTPLPKILQFRRGGLGVSIRAAAQASSQLDVVYGSCTAGPSATSPPLLMYGAHEKS